MSLASRFASNVLSQGLARLLSIGSNLLLLLVVARVMGADLFGHFSYVLALAAISVTFADLGTTAILSQGLVLHEGDQRRRYLGNFLLMRVVLLLPVMLLTAIAALFVTQQERGALLIVAFGLPAMASRFFEPVYQVYGRPWLSLKSNFIFGFSQIALTVVVFWWPQITIPQLITGHVLSNLLYTLTAIFMMWQLVRPDFRVHRAMLLSILKLAAPIGVGAIFSMLLMRLDVILLQHMRSNAEVGYYSAAFRLIDLAVFFAVTIVTPFITILSKDIASDNTLALTRARQFTLVTGLLVLPIALTVPVLASPLVELVWGSTFAPAAEPLRILMVNFVIVFFSLICYSISVASGKVKHAYWVSPLATFVNLILNLWWIPIYGTTGTAWASVVGQAVVLVAAQWYVTRDFGQIYVREHWQRLGWACAALWLFQQLVLPWGSPWAAAAAGLTVFIFLVWHWHLLPQSVVNTLCRRPKTPVNAEDS